GIVTRTVDDRHVRETERKLVHVLHPRLPVSGHARKPRREALALHETNARRGYRLIKQFRAFVDQPRSRVPHSRGCASIRSLAHLMRLSANHATASWQRTNGSLSGPRPTTSPVSSHGRTSRPRRSRRCW